MSLTTAAPIVLSAIAAFLATLSAGVFVKKLQNKVGVVCAFSSGFFIALALFELLPDVSSLSSLAQVSELGLILTAATGFALLLGLDRGFSRVLPREHHMAKKVFQPKVGLLATVEFCSHAFLEGIAIGVGFQLEFGLGLFVAMAVVSHDFCDGISTLALMLNSGNKLRSAMIMLFVAAVAPVLGAVSTLLFAFPSFFLAYALSFLFGSFLYIGAGTLLPDAYKMNGPVVTATLFTLGFSLVFAFSQLAL